MISDDTIRAGAVRFLLREHAFLPDAERVDDVAAAAGEARDATRAERVIRAMADETTAPVAYKPGTGRTLVGLELDSVSEALYWIQRYDESELPFGFR